MKKYLFNKAYEFYPKNINGLDEFYMQQGEIKKMRNKIESTLKIEYDCWINLLNNFNKKSSLFFALDKSNFTLNQPSLAMQIILKEKESFLIFNCYSSLIIPYIYFNLTTHNLSNKLLIRIDSINCTKDLHKEIKWLLHQLKNQFKKDIIPEKYLNEIIPNISFEVISGNFTIKNAFFNTKNLMI